jgi:hypothetical protein
MAPHATDVLMTSTSPTKASSINQALNGDEEDEKPKWPVHSEYPRVHRGADLILDFFTVEVRLKTRSTARFDTVRDCVHQYLASDESIYLPSAVTGWETNNYLREHIEVINACESSSVQQYSLLHFRSVSDLAGVS